MAELSTIARPYAQGLWKALADRGDTAQAAEIEQSLFALSSAVSEPQVAELVSDPKVTDDQMYDLLAGSIGEEAPSQLKGLLRTVIENGRLCALPEIAAQFRAVGAIEKAHEERYRKLLKNVEMQQVFEKAGQTMWECRICGHLVMGVKAPEACPVCGYAQSYFEVRAENY